METYTENFSKMHIRRDVNGEIHGEERTYTHKDKHENKIYTK